MRKSFSRTIVGFLAAAMVIAFAGNVPQTVYADDFSYDDFLTQILVPTYGFSPVGTSKKTVASIDDRNWDNRAGIVTISQQDFNGDGVNDCMVYRIAANNNGQIQTSREEFWLDLYSHDSTGMINLINSVLICSDSDTDFERLRVGLMSKQGQIFIGVERASNPYMVGGGGGISMSWYSYDGASLRPYYQIYSSSAGSVEFTYLYREYSDADNFKETVLWADSDARQSGTQALSYGPESSIMDAVNTGLQMIGLPAPATENYSNAGVTLSPGQENVFPTYFSSQIMKKVFEYDANGPIVNITQRDMSITLSDYTGLNTNQLPQTSAQASTSEAQTPNPQAAAPGTAVQTPDAGAAPGTGTAVPGTGTAAPGTGTAATGMAEPAPDQTAQVVQQDYLIPDSNSKLLTAADIAGFTGQKLNYARNEIYARHGRMFNSIELQQYFATRSWYNPTVPADVFDESVYFNSMEFQNARFLLAQEEALVGRKGGYPLDQPGYDINAVWR